MGAGKYIHRMTLQRLAAGDQDQETGATPQTWQTVTNLWGAIEYLSARDFIAAQAQESEVVARIEIPFRAGVLAGMRLLHRDKFYDITGVLPDKKSGREYLTLPCSEGLIDG
jgi:SPP1 family predicted phage head-tail adaptor